MNYMETLGEKAKIASRAAAAAGTEKKNEALRAISDALLANISRIMDANAQDMEAAQAYFDTKRYEHIGKNVR